MFPTYGFGGVLPDSPDIVASHCFALNGNIFNPECNQMKGVLLAYYESLMKVQLAGPTYFSHILNQANGFVETEAQEISQAN